VDKQPRYLLTQLAYSGSQTLSRLKAKFAFGFLWQEKTVRVDTKYVLENAVQYSTILYATGHKEPAELNNLVIAVARSAYWSGEGENLPNGRLSLNIPFVWINTQLLGLRSLQAQYRALRSLREHCPVEYIRG